ncbi:hypothetical protein RF11_10807 [Thelohanellus kitauei]|uniref:Prefoldin subunit 1 n=1 Tax=Thelohanellus kitauei TaxID=669202 RepID=A0A0C2ISN6_THEKT|nr:hypothetical protein RF11_10807 [Thelohanellus kitauei]
MATESVNPKNEKITAAFQELQNRRNMMNQCTQILQRKIQSMRNANIIKRYTIEEINNQKDGTNFYEPVGRMFVLIPKKDALGFLTAEINENEKAIKSCEDNIENVKNRYKEQEVHTRDLVNNR